MLVRLRAAMGSGLGMLFAASAASIFCAQSTQVRDVRQLETALMILCSEQHCSQNICPHDLKRQSNQVMYNQYELATAIKNQRVAS